MVIDTINVQSTYKPRSTETIEEREASGAAAQEFNRLGDTHGARF